MIEGRGGIHTHHTRTLDIADGEGELRYGF